MRVKKFEKNGFLYIKQNPVDLFKGEYEIRVLDSSDNELENYHLNIKSDQSCKNFRQNFVEFETASDLEHFTLFTSDGTTYDIVSDCYFENCLKMANRGVSSFFFYSFLLKKEP